MRILPWQQAAVTPFAIATLCLFGSSFSQDDGKNDIASVVEEVSAGNIVIEWHRVSITVQQTFETAQDTRDGAAKQRLLASMSRQNGEWTHNHPRHRLLDALHGFTRYYERQRLEIDRLRDLYKNVSPSQRKLLEDHIDYSSKFGKVEQKLANNQHLCDDIIESSLSFYGISRNELENHVRDKESEGRSAERVPVSQALKHMVRDWTGEGDHERHGPFGCILGSLQRLFPERKTDVEEVRILLPGAGLGRLGHDISRLNGERGTPSIVAPQADVLRHKGFEVTINEWSMYMNAAYRLLETKGVALAHSVWPFVDGWSHHLTNANMLRVLQLPDVTIQKGKVVMIEGDFTTEFRNHTQHYDVVVTYFFIDTARNLMSYFDTIKAVLKKGGIWMNLGPLLYGTAPFVQLTLDDIVVISEKMGFEFLETDDSCGMPTFGKPTVRSMEAIYSFDHQALTKNAYKAQFWMARKS